MLGFPDERVHQPVLAPPCSDSSTRWSYIGTGTEHGKRGRYDVEDGLDGAGDGMHGHGLVAVVRVDALPCTQMQRRSCVSLCQFPSTHLHNH